MQGDEPPFRNQSDRARAPSAAWEDVSGGLHEVRPDSALRATDPFDAFASGHDLTGAFGEEAAPDQYHLVDDAGGRFRIDPQSGVIRAADALVIREELGHIHEVCVRAPDGYEARFHLRIATPLPEAVDADGASLFGGVDAFAEPEATLALNWSAIAAALGVLRSRTSPIANAPFGAALAEAEETLATSDGAPAPLSLDETPPGPAAEDAFWVAA